MNITYDESLRLKGIAILLMLWLHCFNNLHSPGYSYLSFIMLDGVPLVYRSTYIAGVVVPLYCFLSGYGLCNKNSFDWKYIRKKLINLLCKYWFVLTVFVVVSTIIDRGYYNFSLNSILGNYLGYDTTYNGTLWFLLPYVLLFLTSRFLFKIFRQKKYSFLSTVLIITFFVLSNWFLKLDANNELAFSTPILVLFLNYFKLLFPFYIGYIAVSFSISDKYKRFFINYRIMIMLLLVIVILTKLFISSYSLCYFYLIPVILFLQNLKYPEAISKILIIFGKQSLFIWFIHGYFTYYIFHPYIYDLKYPLFIYVAVVVISLLLSYILEYLYDCFMSVIRLILNRTETK